MALNDRQKAFCHEYVVDHNSTQAYIRAGYSPQGARQGAARLLSNVDAKALIAELDQALARKAEVTAEWVVRQIRILAEAETNEVPASVKLRALELLGKRLKLWDEAEVAEGTESLTERLERLAGE